MNKNEIVRQYKWLRVLRVFLKIFSGILMFLLTGLVYAIIVFGIIFLNEKLGLDYRFCIFVLYLISLEMSLPNARNISPKMMIIPMSCVT